MLSLPLLVSISVVNASTCFAAVPLKVSFYFRSCLTYVMSPRDSSFFRGSLNCLKPGIFSLGSGAGALDSWMQITWTPYSTARSDIRLVSSLKQLALYERILIALAIDGVYEGACGS